MPKSPTPTAEEQEQPVDEVLDGGDTGVAAGDGVGDTQQTIDDGQLGDEQLGDDQLGDGQADDGQAGNDEPWRQHFEQMGLRDATDLETGLSRLAQSFQQRNEHLQQLVEANRQMQAQLRQQSTGHTPQSQSVQQAQPQAEDDPFSLPALPQGVERYRVLKTNDQGQEFWDWKDDTPESVRTAGDQYSAKLVDFQMRMQTPDGFREILDAYFERNVLPKVEEQYETRQSRQSDEQAEQQFLQENESWFFEQDAVTGKPLLDPVTGEPRVSVEGRRFQKELQDLAEAGVQSFQRQLQIANSLFQRQREAAEQQPVQQRQTAAAANAAARRQMLGRRATPNTSAPPQQQSATGGKGPQDRRGYGAKLLENLRANGVEIDQ